MMTPLAPEELEKNKRAKELLCVEAERLKESTLWRETADRLKAMQQEWKMTGPVPREEADALYHRFRTACDAFFENRTRSFQNLELERIDNLYRKIELCEKAETAAALEDTAIAAEEMQRLFAEWKEIGPVPREKADALWERFRTAQDVVYRQRKAWFEEKEKERGENLLKKEALCLEMEALAGSEDFGELTHLAHDLQERWKSLGPVPREKADAIWERFKSASDQFFQRRNMHLNQLDEARLENLLIRQRLCEEARQLQESTEWGETSEKIRQMQADWKKAWPVPKEEGDKLWEAFRGACDHFFERKRIHFEEKHKAWQKNQAVWRMNMEKAIQRKEEEASRVEAAMEYEKSHIEEWQHRLENLPGELKSIDMKLEIEEKIARAHAELDRKKALVAQLLEDITEIKTKLEKE